MWHISIGFIQFSKQCDLHPWGTKLVWINTCKHVVICGIHMDALLLSRHLSLTLKGAMSCFLLGRWWACFKFNEQEVHMHSTKNVNEKHSFQFLMETSEDFGKRRWGWGGWWVPIYPLVKIQKWKQDLIGNDSFLVKGWKKCVEKLSNMCLGYLGVIEKYSE